MSIYDLLVRSDSHLTDIEKKKTNGTKSIASTFTSKNEWTVIKKMSSLPFSDLFIEFLNH